MSDEALDEGRVAFGGVVGARLIRRLVRAALLLVLVVLDDVGLHAVASVQADEGAVLVELAVLAVAVLGHAVVLVVELLLVVVDVGRSTSGSSAAAAACHGAWTVGCVANT